VSLGFKKRGGNYLAVIRPIWMPHPTGRETFKTALTGRFFYTTAHGVALADAKARGVSRLSYHRLPIATRCDRLANALSPYATGRERRGGWRLWIDSLASQSQANRFQPSHAAIALPAY
jgi:hypothetical protein